MTFMVLHNLYASKENCKVIIPIRSLAYALQQGGHNSRIFVNYKGGTVEMVVVESIETIANYLRSVERDAASTMML